MNLLQAQALCKTYGIGETAVQALKDVSFSVPKGEFVAVVGESGSGKSTLLNLLGGLDTPTSGKVLLDGRDLFAMKERERTIFRRRNIGFVFQAFNLIPELTVEQNILFWKNCWMCWTSASGAVTCPASFPAGSSSAWPSGGRSSPVRR